MLITQLVKYQLTEIIHYLRWDIPLLCTTCSATIWSIPDDQQLLITITYFNNIICGCSWTLVDHTVVLFQLILLFMVKHPTKTMHVWLSFRKWWNWARELSNLTVISRWLIRDNTNNTQQLLHCIIFYIQPFPCHFFTHKYASSLKCYISPNLWWILLNLELYTLLYITFMSDR